MRNFSIQLDVGYVLDYTPWDMDNPEFQNLRGTKLKLEFRYYLPSSLSKKTAQQYLSVEPYANIINFDRQISQTECFDLECTILYTRNYDFMVKYREQGVSLKYGVQLITHRIVFDLTAGLTLRDIDYIKPSIPTGFNQVEFVPLVDLTPNEEKRIDFRPIIGAKIGYKIK